MNQELLQEGINLKNQKRYDEAIQILTKCDQNDPQVLYHIGDIYLIFKYPNEALQCFQKSLEINPNQALIVKEIGRAHMLKRDFTKAVNSFLKAYKMDQQQADIFKLITMCYMESQEYDKAFVYANQQLARFPRDPDSYCLRGKYYLNTCKYEQSIDSLNICLKLRPNNAYALGTKGQALMMLGKMQESHQCLNEAIQLNPNIAELHVDTGLLFEGMNNVYLAMMSYDQALQIQHDNPISIQRLYNLKLHQYLKLNVKPSRSKLTHIYQEVIQTIPQSGQYFIGLFYTLSNFLLGYLSVTDMTKMNYQKQIGYIKNMIDINQQLGLSFPPISSFFRGIECYCGKTNTELQQYIQEWMSQKYLIQNNLKDLNNVLGQIVSDVIKHKNTLHQFYKQEDLNLDHLNLVMQTNENQIYTEYWYIRGLHDGVNMLQRMLVFCTPFLKSWEGDFNQILINILCYGD